MVHHLVASGMVEQNVAQIAGPSLEGLGYSLVRVKFYNHDKKHTLQIMIDRVDGTQVTVKDCEQASRHLSAVLDVDDPIGEAYSLEMSSAGIDRPLTRADDFKVYVGHKISVKLSVSVDDARRFRGTLLSVNDASTTIELLPDDRSEPVEIAFDTITSAKLVLTDELIAAAANDSSLIDSPVEE